MRTRGFTIVEVIVTITIMGILLTLAVVGVGATQMNARDNERKADIEAISLHLESFYSGGLRDDSVVPTIINYVTNPSYETNTTGWAASCGATGITRDTTQAYIGSASMRLNTTGVDQCTYFGAPYIVTTVGRTYTMSAWVKGSGSAQLTLSSHPGGAIIASSSTVALGSSWQRITVTGTTTSGVVDVYPVLWQRSSGTLAMYIDAVMTTETSYLTDYADGSTSGWVWSGTTNNSSSTGPVIQLETPGTYPSISLLQSPLLTAYLEDTDPKSFLAPGTSDPYASFLIATNTTQTTTGVTPQPTISQYIYQPLDANGALCTDNDCRKYNLYYRLEGDSTVYMVTSKSQ
jgi:prepilin-type N-terminal cleavage/methylation domain-containing protein